MTDKQFTTVGTSRHQGKVKMRFATDPTRVKKLMRNDHSEVNLIDLPWAMTKVEAAEHLIQIGFADGNSEIQAAIDHVISKNGGKAKVESPQQVDPMTVPALM